MRVVVLAAISLLAANMHRALTWASSGVFDRSDVLFDTDPNVYWGAFAHGWSNPTLVHAAASLVGVLSRAVAATLLLFGAAGDALHLRETLALSVAPLCGLASVCLLFSIGRLSGISRASSAAVAMTAATAFVARLFFTIPESYPLAALLLLSAFWLVALESSRDRNAPLAAWIAVVALSAGVTLTNGFIACLIFLACRWSRGKSVPRTAAVAITIGAVALAFVVLLVVTSNVVFERDSTLITEQIDGVAGWASPFFYDMSLTGRALQLAALPIDMLGFAQLGDVANPLPIKSETTYIAFTPKEGFDGVFYAFAGGVVWFTLYRAGIRNARTHTLAVAALVALLANAALHAVFGLELFLYALHFWVLLAVAAITAIQSGSTAVHSLTSIFALLVIGAGFYQMLNVDRLLGL